MLQSDRLADLIKRNRDLLARAADLRSHTAETIIASQHLAAILREKGAERGWVRLEPVVVPLNRWTTP